VVSVGLGVADWQATSRRLKSRSNFRGKERLKFMAALSPTSGLFVKQPLLISL
jgi:hypothetical protein